MFNLVHIIYVLPGILMMLFGIVGVSGYFVGTYTKNYDLAIRFLVAAIGIGLLTFLSLVVYFVTRFGLGL